MAKLTTSQLKQITAEAKKIRSAAGTKQVTKFKMSWRDAIKQASTKICGRKSGSTKKSTATKRRTYKKK